MSLNLLPAKTSRLSFFVLLGFFCLSLVYFISRGPLRPVDLNKCDFTLIYFGSSFWVKGLSPYNHNEINKLCLKIDEPADKSEPITYVRPAVYPITIFPIIAPLTFMKLPDAKFVWNIINCLAFFGAFLALISYSKLKILEKDAILICCLALSLNPIHRAINEGNPSALACSLMVISLWAADRDHAVLGGILFALTLCLKVHATLIFLLYFILTKKYKLLLVSILSTTLILLIAIIPSGLNLEWLYAWRSNVNAAFSGGINDIHQVKAIGYLNLDYVAIKFINNISIIKIIVLFLFLGYTTLLYRYNKFVEYNYKNLMLLSYVVVVGLLLIPYQRFTNGVVLIFPIALAFLWRRNHLINYGNIMLILLIPFLFPLSAIIDYFLKKYNYYWLINSPWFNCIIYGNRTWLLLIMSMVMIRVMQVNYLKCHSSRIRG